MRASPSLSRTTRPTRAAPSTCWFRPVCLPSTTTSLTPTPAEINKDESKVTVTPVDASQTPNAYNEGKPAIINNTWLDRAGIEPSLAVFEDDPESKEAEPYINVFAARSEDISDETLNKLVELWQTPEVAEATAKDSKGTSVPVYRDQKELNDILDRLQNK